MPVFYPSVFLSLMPIRSSILFQRYPCMTISLILRKYMLNKDLFWVILLGSWELFMKQIDLLIYRSVVNLRRIFSFFYCLLSFGSKRGLTIALSPYRKMHRHRKHLKHEIVWNLLNKWLRGHRIFFKFYENPNYSIPLHHSSSFGHWGILL